MPSTSNPLPTPPQAPAVGPVGLADALGWASAALGASMLLSRRRFLRAVGVHPDRAARAATAAVGIREFTAFTAIVGMRHRRVGAWSRVGGDLIDLGLLAGACRTRREHAGRLLAFAALIVAILSTDAYVAVQLSRAEGTRVEDGSTSAGTVPEPEPAGGPAGLRTAITVRGPETRVKQAFMEFGWSAFDPRQLDGDGRLRFAAAPGARGTEIHLHFDPPVLGGAFGAAALKLAGKAPDQRATDELRRFKAIFETGVEVRSDKTPDGHSALRQIFQRPAQPQEVST